MHYPLTMAEVESLISYQHKYNHAHVATYLKELKYIVTDIVINKFGIEAPKIGIVHVFEYQAGRFALHTYKFSFLSFGIRLPLETGFSPSSRMERGGISKRREVTHLAVPNNIEQCNNVRST
jgi:hypothetical protein